MKLLVARLTTMGSLFFGQYLGPSGNEDPEPSKDFIFVGWWTGLSSSQLYWVDYEPIYAQKNIGPKTYIHSYIQTYTYCKING